MYNRNPFSSNEGKKINFFPYFSKIFPPSSDSTNFEEFVISLFKNTKLAEICEILRFIFSKINRQKLKEHLKIISILNGQIVNENFIYFREISLNKGLISRISKQQQHDYDFFLFLIDYALKKKFLNLVFYLLKKLETKILDKKKSFIKICLFKFDFYFFQKNYKNAKSFINFLQFLTERDEIGGYNQSKILERAGLICLKENKILLAFSFFFESYGKLNFRNKIGITRIFEFLIFISNFFKKQKINLFCRKGFYHYKILNFIFLEFINIGLQKKKLVLLESSLKEKNWNQKNKSMKYFISKFLKINIKNSLIFLLKPFLRISIFEFSMRLGISKRKTNLIIRKMIIKGEINGFLDKKTDSFTGLKFSKNNAFMIDLLGIIIQIDNSLSRIF